MIFIFSIIAGLQCGYGMDWEFGVNRFFFNVFVGESENRVYPSTLLILFSVCLFFLFLNWSGRWIMQHHYHITESFDFVITITSELYTPLLF